MNKNMVETMQNDMHLFPYRDESISYYLGRLVYSALSYWIRACIMDRTSESNGTKSKAYILDSGKEVLWGFVECIPECKQWISSTDKEIEDRISEMVIDIRNKMIFGGELIELNSKRNVILPEGKVQPCASGIVRILGATNYGKKCQAVGITRIFEDVHAESMNIDFCSIIGIDEYILSLYKKAKWFKVDDISNYEIFNSTAKRAPYQSWEDNLNKSRMFHLIRMSLYNDLHEYYLLKFENGEIFICKLEELLAEGKEERRVILGLRKMYQNQMNALYEHKGFVILLNLFCRLPLREERILETYCWPERSFDDKLNYVVPIKIWDEIKGLLENGLGIRLKEKE